MGTIIELKQSIHCNNYPMNAEMPHIWNQIQLKLLGQRCEASLAPKGRRSGKKMKEEIKGFSMVAAITFYDA